jgi:hypothetical protein
VVVHDVCVVARSVVVWRLLVCGSRCVVSVARSCAARCVTSRYTAGWECRLNICSGLAPSLAECSAASTRLLRVVYSLVCAQFCVSVCVQRSRNRLCGGYRQAVCKAWCGMGRAVSSPVPVVCVSRWRHACTFHDVPAPSGCSEMTVPALCAASVGE